MLCSCGTDISDGKRDDRRGRDLWMCPLGGGFPLLLLLKVQMKFAHGAPIPLIVESVERCCDRLARGSQCLNLFDKEFEQVPVFPDLADHQFDILTCQDGNKRTWAVDGRHVCCRPLGMPLSTSFAMVPHSASTSRSGGKLPTPSIFVPNSQASHSAWTEE